MEIWVHRNGEYAGRFSESIIREKIADRSLSENDLAWDQAKALWKPLGEFLASLPATEPTPAATPSAPVPAAISEAKAEVPVPAESSVPAVEAKPAEIRQVRPPPLPSIAAAAPAAPRAVGPPPLPATSPTPGPSIPATTPPEGEKIWNP